MELQINRWGNSLALRLPQTLSRKAGLRDGTRVEATIGKKGELRVVPVVPTTDHSRSRAELMAQVQALQAEFPMGTPVVRWLRDQGY